jgi:hypothetical protein
MTYLSKNEVIKWIIVTPICDIFIRYNNFFVVASISVAFAITITICITVVVVVPFVSVSIAIIICIATIATIASDTPSTLL